MRKPNSTNAPFIYYAAAFFACMALLPQSAYSQAQWEVVSKKDGVTVSRAELPNRQYPSFRGEGIVEANPYHVFAVLMDIDRHTEWMFHCSVSRLLSKKSKTNWILYNVTDAPWPVWDRDAVTITEVDVKSEFVRIRFKATNAQSMKPRKHTVRMNSFEGSYNLIPLDENRTRVVYTINADPGGSIPDWLVKISVELLPLKTIDGLRKQITKTKGIYKQRIGELKREREELLIRR